MRRTSGVVLTVTGFLTCLCHLIITLPLLAGTAVGSFLTHNIGRVTTFASIYFVVASAVGYWFLFGRAHPKRDRDAACPACGPVAPDMQLWEQSPMQEDLPAQRR